MKGSGLLSEFREVRSMFDPRSQAIWRKGIEWINQQNQNYGPVSWDPFFIGLLDEREAFAGRAMEAVFNRRRLLHRLSKVRRAESTSSPPYFGFELKEMGRSDDPKYDGIDFFYSLYRRRARNLSPEQTLRALLNSSKLIPPNDWDIGSVYLTHPTTLGPDNIFSDAIIGELAGSQEAFNSVLDSLLNQHSDQVTLTIAFRHNKLMVLPTSRFGRSTIGRMPEHLSAVEAKYINRVKLVESPIIQEFEELINSRLCRESDIHSFFESHPELLGSRGYVSVSSHPVLTFIDDRRRIPDFILEREDGFCDLLEIKKPDERVVTGTQHRRMFSVAVHRAIAQLREYASYFETAHNRELFSKSTGLNIFQPNLVVLIGRGERFETQSELIDLHATLPRSASIQTYDDVVAFAKSRAVFVEQSAVKKIPLPASD